MVKNKVALENEKYVHGAKFEIFSLGNFVYKDRKNVRDSLTSKSSLYLLVQIRLFTLTRQKIKIVFVPSKQISRFVIIVKKHF